jgi:hypothetical protein
MRGLLVVVVFGFGSIACGSTAHEYDAPVPPPDARLDAPPDGQLPATAPPSALVLSAGGTTTSSRYTLDVQLGEMLVPEPVTSGDTTLTPTAPIHP